MKFIREVRHRFSSGSQLVVLIVAIIAVVLTLIAAWFMTVFFTGALAWLFIWIFTFELTSPSWMEPVFEINRNWAFLWTGAAIWLCYYVFDGLRRRALIRRMT